MTFDTPDLVGRDLNRHLAAQEEDDALDEARDEAKFRARRTPVGARLYAACERMSEGYRERRMPELAHAVRSAWEQMIRDHSWNK